jgi:hypothetical protein
MVSGSADASSTMTDEQSRLEEASSSVSSTGSVCSDEGSGSSRVSNSDFVLASGHAGDGSVSSSDHGPLTLVVHVAAGDGSDPATTMVFGYASTVGSPCLNDSTHLGFGLSKSQIWLLEWIKDQLKINEEVKDKDHSAFLKGMEEDFLWINLVARE